MGHHVVLVPQGRYHVDGVVALCRYNVGGVGFANQVPVQQGRYNVDGIVALRRYNVDGAGIVYRTALDEVRHHMEVPTLDP
eukprot:15271866-Alexandrium_andersonii.AAC.1